jgi:hypothetical protein
MRQRSVTLVIGATAALCSALFSGTSAAAVRGPASAGGRAGTPDAARQVPGSAMLSPAWIKSVSCASAGNCSAGGFFDYNTGNRTALVVGEKNGTWGTAMTVRGLAALNTGGIAAIGSVSCASAGNCSAGGFYTSRKATRAFVVSEKDGTWGMATAIPGLPRLNKRGGAAIDSVSCASAGNCSAVGTYNMRSSLYFGLDHEKVFVVSENNGSWGAAQQVRGLNSSGDAGIESLSCASAGNCSAGGTYNVRFGGLAFAVSETNGIWGTAHQVPGLNENGSGAINSVSCASAGNCSAGGFYTNRSGTQAFVIDQTNGTWGTAQQVRGLNSSRDAGIESLSCASASNCSAAGSFAGSGGRQRAFVVSQDNGIWGAARPVRGFAAFNASTDAESLSVSCATAGNCSAGASYLTASRAIQAFVVDEKNGTWGAASKVPGLPRLNKSRDAVVDAVSCGSAGNCSAAGYYSDIHESPRAFVVSERRGIWGTARPVRS